MAFYFALFNVSNVNQQLKGQAHKRERRRHSLATSSHIVKDYRLLPRPKIIFHETATDNETVSTLLDETEEEVSSGQNSFKYLNTSNNDSLKYRRASSPENRRQPENLRHAMDIAFNEPFTIAEIERHLRRVKFSSPAARSVNENTNNVKENQDDEQVWIRRTLSPPNAANSDPWVYSLDLESKRLNEKSTRPPLPERQQRPTMGVSALELRSGSVERNTLRNDLKRHVNTWPEIRANRTRWRPTLLLRRHSGGNLNENDRLTSMFQKRRSSGDKNNSQIPYQSITPTSPPQDPSPNEPQQKPYKQLPPKLQKSIVVITPTNRQSRQTTTTSSVGQFRTNFNSWAQNAIYRNRNEESNVPFVRLNNDNGKREMIRSSVF